MTIHFIRCLSIVQHTTPQHRAVQLRLVARLGRDLLHAAIDLTGGGDAVRGDDGAAQHVLDIGRRARRDGIGGNASGMVWRVHGAVVDWMRSGDRDPGH